MMKTEYPGFIKDDTPGRARAVLNTDAVSLQAFREARAKDRAITQVVNEVATLKQDMTDIKRLLTQLIDGRNNGKNN